VSEPSACPKCQHKYPHHNFGCEDYDAMRHTTTAQPSDEHVCPACRGTGRTDNIAYTPPPAQPSDEELAAVLAKKAVGDGELYPSSRPVTRAMVVAAASQGIAAGREQGYDKGYRDALKKTDKSVVRHDPILPMLTTTQAISFLNKIDVPDGDDSCWTWQGAVNPRGYGQFSFWSNGHKTSLPVHRVSHAMFNGEPGKLYVHHVCRNTRCVNPSHLLACTNRENSVTYGRGITATNADKTHCHRGHPFDAENTLERDGGRTCRTCQRVYKKAYRDRLAGREGE